MNECRAETERPRLLHRVSYRGVEVRGSRPPQPTAFYGVGGGLKGLRGITPSTGPVAMSPLVPSPSNPNVSHNVSGEAEQQRRPTSCADCFCLLRPIAHSEGGPNWAVAICISVSLLCSLQNKQSTLNYQNHQNVSARLPMMRS